MKERPDFHKPTENDRQWMNEVLSGTDYFGSFNAFGSLWLWKDMYRIEVVRFQDAALLRGRAGENMTYYMYPIGRSYDVREAVTVMRRNAEEQGTKLVMYSVEERQLDELREAFPGEFSFEETRWDFDYIYRSEHLIALSGKKFHSKRNHISQFQRLYPDWQYEDISAANVNECIACAGEWLKKAIEGQDEERVFQLCMENSVIALALRHYDEMGFVGGLLRVGGKVIALTLGEPLNRRVFATHFEKANTDFEGAYTMINKQFAAHRLADYEYINREEDMGVESLRKAKLSYHPDILLKKYRVEDQTPPVNH